MPFELVRNDITQMNTDAIVNAANRSLLGGGGVDGAIHRAAGPELLEECRTLGGCETGEAKITKGYRLPARYVIHTVGPVWRGGSHGEKELLTACYQHSLELAVSSGCESIAFPLISAGAYGYPGDQAMAVAMDTITRFLMDHDLMVYLVLFGRPDFLTGKKLFRDIREYIDDVYAEKHEHRNLEYTRRRRWQENEADGLSLDLEISESLHSMSCLGAPAPVSCEPKETAPDWKEILKQTDEGFSQALLRMIDERNMKDSDCYKKANVDRKLFSKIRTNPNYCPSKPTVFAFAVALELTLPETKKLLKRAGFALTHSSKFDRAMEYFITNRVYNVYEINEILFGLDLPLLGSGTH